eukprot:SAG31_NODE_2201_length_6201_cov_14.443461_5_plen_142_part_00
MRRRGGGTVLSGGQTVEGTGLSAKLLHRSSRAQVYTPVRVPRYRYAYGQTAEAGNFSTSALVPLLPLAGPGSARWSPSPRCTNLLNLVCVLATAVLQPSVSGSLVLIFKRRLAAVKNFPNLKNYSCTSSCTFEPAGTSSGT